MRREDKNPNRIYIPVDLVEDILFRLPLKSILKFKSVSKQWKSILESRKFAERRMSVRKNRKILAVGDQSESRFYSGDEEMEMVYLKGDDVATRPSLSCDGLVCIPVPGCVNVLNPSTGELLSFPFNVPSHSHYDEDIKTRRWWIVFPGYWEIGFGKDKVNGSYKVVRMPTLDDPNHDCEILDVNIGEWRKLNPPLYQIEANVKSAFVNGSIYWLIFNGSYRILALDLHTEEFRDVVSPPPLYTPTVQLVNFEDRLAVIQTRAFTNVDNKSHCMVEIWSMDAQEKRWSTTYSISLSHRYTYNYMWFKLGFRHVAVSKQGSIFFYDSKKRLFKYCPETDLVLCLSQDISVICPFVENLVPLGPKISTSIGYRCGVSYLNQGSGSRISSIVRRMEPLFPNILLTSALVSLVIFGYRYRYST